MPAMNILETDRPVMVAAMIMGTDGGMMGPRQEDAAVMATEKGLVSDRAVPEMPAKTMDARTFA